MAVIREKFLKKFIDFVENHQDIVIFQHVKPDGDCMGCSLGLKQILLNKYPNKKVYSVGSSFGVYPWLNMKFDTLPNDFNCSKALAIIVDVGTSARIQLFNEYFRATDKGFGSIVKIDHHGCDSDFPVDLAWDDPTYVASACQIMQIADFYSWDIDSKAATFLLLGLITDSGCYRYDSTLPRSLVIGAKLMRLGADSSFLNKNLAKRTFKQIETNNKLLSHVSKGQNLLWIDLSADLQKKLGIVETSGLVNVMSSIEENICWVLFTHINETVSVDFRSVGMSVRNIAIKFGGGGHENAAGCVLPSKDEIPKVIEALQKAVDDYIALNPVENMEITNKLSDSKLNETLDVDTSEIIASKQTLEEAKETVKQVKEAQAEAYEELKNVKKP